VVLPQPDGPRNEKNSPFLILSDAELTAVKLPNLMVTRSSSTSALIPYPFIILFSDLRPEPPPRSRTKRSRSKENQPQIASGLAEGLGA
jgi:hypothetical protein